MLVEVISTSEVLFHLRPFIFPQKLAKPAEKFSFVSRKRNILLPTPYSLKGGSLSLSVSLGISVSSRNVRNPPQAER